MRIKAMRIGAAVVLLTACCAEAALIKPSGLSVVKSWNFDGDGAIGGTVDSGASGTDWVNNSADSVVAETDSIGGAAFTNANKNANLFVDATAGTLTYQAPVINESANMKFDLGGDMNVGWFDMRAMAEALPGGSTTFSAKYSFRDSGGNDLFVLNLRKDNNLRWTTASGDLNFASEKVNAFNSYQIAWDSGKVSMFWDDEANGGANATTYLDESYIASSVAAVAEIKCEITTSGTSGKATLDNLNIEAAIPEPATAGLLGISSIVIFALRRLKKNYRVF